MIASLVLAAVLAPATSGLTGGAFHCVSTHESYQKPFDIIDFEGVRYGTCCGGCAAGFIKDPAKMIAADQKEGKLFGESLFDVVSGARISEAQAKAHADYKGVRYLFASQTESKAFSADPSRFTAAPKKEVLHCPVLNEAIPNIASAGGFVDFKGVRYYVCCSSCLSAMRKDPAKYTAKFESKAKPAVAEKNAKVSKGG